MMRFRETFDHAAACIRSVAQGRLKDVDVTLVRDVHGRVQVVLGEHDPNLAEDVKKALAASLGEFFAGEVWSKKPSQREPVYDLVRARLKDERVDWPPPGGRQLGDPHWYVAERHVSKSSWACTPPWPREGVPIVAFYSFKGGVGRTTALACVASILAQRGYGVAVVDMDLEAPGLETLLLPDAEPSEGALDYLIEKPILGKKLSLAPLLRQGNDNRIIGNGRGITVLGAGSLDDSYMEKLARLDVEFMVRQPGADTPIDSMFKELRVEARPDLIFVDCRAGLHDLGGLVLARMAHLSVVLAMDSEQNYRGLGPVLHVLGCPTAQEALPLRLVQGLTPLGAAGPSSKKRFVDRCYDLFVEHYYDEGKVPDIGDKQAAHYPIHVDDLVELRPNWPWDVWKYAEPLYRSLADDVLAKTGVAKVEDKLAAIRNVPPVQV